MSPRPPFRIALVATELAGFHSGGIGTYVSSAAQALSDRGHEVWLITYLPNEQDRAAIENLPGFCQVLFVDDHPSANSRIGFGLARRTLRFAQLAHEVLLSAGVSFDYIEFADYEAAGVVAVTEQRLFGSYGDAVLAVALHSPTYDCWVHNELGHVFGPSQREVAALEHEAIRMAPVVWSPSRNLRSIVCDRLGLVEDDVPIIRYPVPARDAVSESGDGERTEAARSPSHLRELNFLFFGRIEPRKGVRELVAAFERMPELSIECIGSDGNTAPLQSSEVAFLQRRGAANVRFSPALDRDALLQKLEEADVVVLPSRWDNWPNACLEAMAAGCVVVGGRNSGMEEMITHGETGFLVDSTCPDAIVDVIQRDLLAALPRLADIGAAAARRSRELSAPSLFVDGLERLVTQHRGAGRLPAVPKCGDRVSIVVPYYREDLSMVGAAIDSACHQTHQNLEILLVNDGSPRPDAQEILADLEQRDARIRVLHKRNGGLASARNHAIDRATGDFVLCLDADNLLRRDYAATGVEVFARAPDTVAMTPRFEAFDHLTGQVQVVVQAMPADRPLALFRNSLGDGGAMFRREVFELHGLRYDPVVDCYSDWALWLDLMRLGLRVQTVPRVLYDYRIRPDSMMAEQALETHLAMLGLLIDRHLPTGNEKEMLVTLAQGWGVGALVAALGRSHQVWEDPVASARHLQHVPCASELFLHGLQRVSERHPIVGGCGAAMVKSLMRMHGWFKRRRLARESAEPS